ncbi:hypothetical protein P7L66_13295 [Tistrella mobilis]|uniref:hypothetical protein n=1 Tax=Tistrella mobilis TaxID=171437 RepID=UPI0035565B74
MLKIDITSRPTFTVPVEVHLDGTQRFRATFEVVEDADLDSLTQQYGQPDPSAPWSAAGDKALLRRVWIGWQDIVDASRQPIEFGPEARDYLLSVVPIRAAVARAFFEGLAGGARKN